MEERKNTGFTGRIEQLTVVRAVRSGMTNIIPIIIVAVVIVAILAMFALAGLGIAYHAKPKVRAGARQSISSIGLDGILYFLGLKDSQIDP